MVISLVTLCGLPGCGKTTFCKQFCSYASSSARQFDVPRFSVVHIEFDLIEQQLKGKSHEFDPGVWKSARKMLVQNVINTKKSGTANVLILVDDNMYLKSMRHEMVRIAEAFHISYVQLYFDISSCVAKQRNESRRQCGTAVPQYVIESMEKALEKPKSVRLGQGSHISWNKRTLIITEAQQLLLASMDNWKSIVMEPIVHLSMQPMDTLRQKITEKQPFDHVIDIKLRSVVGCLIKEAREESVSTKRIAEYAHELAAHKKSVIGRVKIELANEELDDDQKLAYGVSIFLNGMPQL